ncbi:MAG TPA: tRNA (adenosine(37)-N6)-threonylcarbamoyltransferase complex dimerization subunit type 1 TsaB [Planctomycetota bacterium]|nr:tRNA (adenosine(37)-N6)-threonylcarbamoyltransferase complex dimerization subunit type 1 TsaB [Planctomycetota bacterium]
MASATPSARGEPAGSAGTSASRILAIDVSGPSGGAALLGPEGVLVERVPPAVRRGRDLVPAVARLLDARGLSPGDLDLVACGVGPGSFTGIRIGIATAATLAYAADAPVLDVGSLFGIAFGASATFQRVVVLLDARQGRVFRGRFRREGERLVAEADDDVPTAEEAAAALPPGAYVLGDARAKYAPLFAAFPGEPDAPVRPDAIARLAAERFAAGERKRPDELRPVYLRLSDPEIRRAQRAP